MQSEEGDDSNIDPSIMFNSTLTISSKSCNEGAGSKVEDSELRIEMMSCK